MIEIISLSDKIVAYKVDCKEDEDVAIIRHYYEDSFFLSFDYNYIFLEEFDYLSIYGLSDISTMSLFLSGFLL
jgi:hypothetical protein